MKAIYITRPGEVEIREIPMPEYHSGQGTALLKVLFGGICGSDLGSYRGSFAYFDYPRIPGHEFSAEILQIDENARGLAPGDIVTCNPYFNCQKCYSCLHGRVNACMDNQTMGCQRDGAFCEYIVMPVDRVYHGKGLPPRVLALIEPFCISYHGVRRAGIRPGSRVLVVGGGTIGVLAANAAKSLGAEVYLCDIPSARAKLQRSQDIFGFAGILWNEGPESLARAVRRITGTSGTSGGRAANGFDICIEAVGLPSTFQDCIDCAAFGGTVVQIGVGKKSLDFHFTDIQKKELNIYGSRNAQRRDFLELIDLVRAGGTNLEKVLTNVYPFADAPKAFADFSANAGSMLKVGIDFS